MHDEEGNYAQTAFASGSSESWIDGWPKGNKMSLVTKTFDDLGEIGTSLSFVNAATMVWRLKCNQRVQRANKRQDLTPQVLELKELNPPLGHVRTLEPSCRPISHKRHVDFALGS